MLWLLLSLLGASGLAPFLSGRGRWGAYLPALVPAAGFLWLVFGFVPGTEQRIAWFPSLGAEFVLLGDPLGWMMAMLVTGIGTVIAVYAAAYLDGDSQRGRFLAILFAFMTSMVGVVLADNVLVLFIFWELTSVTSYLLIGYHHGEKKARGHALQALLVTGFGGVAMLVGMLLLVEVTGTWRLSEMMAAADQIQASAAYPAILALVLLGAFTKSAQFPFHFWLPNAMSAPTPVSAFLHSATMVKAGVFLLARVDPILGGTPSWSLLLVSVGLVTFLLGGVAGFFQTDLKRVLAYTTVGVLGALTVLLGLPGEKARTAFVLLLLAHALYKAGLFMIVGIVDHATHTRDWRQLGNLARLLPLTAAAAILAAASKAGLPPLIGFLAKEKSYMASLAASPGLELVVTFLLLAGNVLMVALALRVGFGPFFSRAEVEQPVTHAPGWGLWLGPVLLAGAAVALGAFPAFLQGQLLGPMLTLWLGHPPVSELKLWHGFNLPLLLSVLTLAGGVALWAWSRSATWQRLTERALRDPCERLYERGLAGLIAGGAWVTTRLQPGDLRQYVGIIAGATVGLVAIEFARKGFWPEGMTISAVELVPMVAALLIVIGTIGAVAARRRFLVLTWLAVVGFALSWWFLYYSGPDLALTLLSVETITILLLALSVRRLPDPLLPTRAWARAVRAVLATAGGITIALLLLKAKWIQLADGVGEEMVARSLPEGKGANVVNVILVDFRALDTLGEITVLAIAALGVVGLLSTFKNRSATTGEEAS